MKRDATLRLTAKDKEAAKAATLGTHGVVQRDGTLWIIMTVVRSHYKTGTTKKLLTDDRTTGDREKVYRAGNAIAEWLGLSGWTDIVYMQNPERIDEFRKMIQAATWWG
jgi:hypothetical protein